ncbi:MAG: heavy metal translocating P-type ATPase [Eubacteriales bacterium]|nr:heavy metal translocating P-type ATPase [Eubacteriales bacterium]
MALTTMKFKVGGMSCSACVKHLETGIAKLAGVTEVRVNLLSEQMFVEANSDSQLSPEEIIKAVEGLGYTAVFDDPNQREKSRSTAATPVIPQDRAGLRLALTLLFAIPLIYLSMGMMLEANWPGLKRLLRPENLMFFALLLFLLSLPIFYLHRRMIGRGFQRIVARDPNMDSLIALGTTAAFVNGLYTLLHMSLIIGHEGSAHLEHELMNLSFESAAMILAFVGLGKYLEARAKGQSSNAIRALIELKPKTALRLNPDGSREEVDVASLEVGDRVLVAAGQSVPADGVILEGRGSLNEAAMTGESLPVEKTAGDSVLAATLLAEGHLEIEVRRRDSESTLAEVIRLVEEATATRAPISKLADRLSAVFVPTILVLALLSYLGWRLSGRAFDFALSRAIAVLVVSCPCALGLATPTAIMVASGRAARDGLLIRNAEILEKLKSIDCVVFDKTGTLSAGQVEVVELHSLSDLTKHEALSIAARLEQASAHPLAAAIVRAAETAGIEIEAVEDYLYRESRSVSGLVDGQRYELGNLKGLTSLARELKLTFDPKAAELDALDAKIADAAQTPLYLCRHEGDLLRPLAALALMDPLKSDAAATIDALKAIGRRTVMLSGDHERCAQAIQAKIHCDDFVAELLPHEKAGRIAELQAKGYQVAMVGDGINDAPALAQADIGVAIASGSDIAMESADVILMKNHPYDLINALRLSKATVRNIRENLFWALIYNLIAIPIAMGLLEKSVGLMLSPSLSALAMSGSSLIVVGNALRLKRFAWQRPEQAMLSSQTLTKSSGLNLTDENPSVTEATEPDMHERLASNARSEGDKLIEKSGGSMMKKRIKIEGMSCQHCVKHVRQALEALARSESVEVNLENNEAIVEIDAEINDERLKKAVADAGYEALSVEDI